MFIGPICQKHYKRLKAENTDTCKVDHCQSEAFHYGHCRPHEHLTLRALTPEQLTDVRQQVLDVITPDPVTGCWIFNQTTVDGYGRINAKHGAGQWLAHRLTWHLWYNGHAQGMQLDHLCESPLCISPFHLNPATPKANTRLRDIRAENPEFPWHVDKGGQEVDPPSWPMGLVVFAMMNGLPAGLPDGELHRQTSTVTGAAS